MTSEQNLFSSQEKEEIKNYYLQMLQKADKGNEPYKKGDMFASYAGYIEKGENYVNEKLAELDSRIKVENILAQIRREIKGGVEKPKTQAEKDKRWDNKEEAA